MSETMIAYQRDRGYQAGEEVSRNLQAIKGILYGDGGVLIIRCSCHPLLNSSLEPLPELIAQLAQETYSTDLLLLLLQNIARFDFEARKDVVQIFNNLL